MNTSITPLPVGFNTTSLSVPVAAIVMLVVLPTIKSVTRFALVRMLPVTSSDDKLPTLVMFG